MADKIVSWGGFDSKGTSGMGVTGSLAVSGSSIVVGDLTISGSTTGITLRNATNTNAATPSITGRTGGATATITLSDTVGTSYYANNYAGITFQVGSGGGSLSTALALATDKTATFGNNVLIPVGSRFGTNANGNSYYQPFDGQGITYFYNGFATGYMLFTVSNGTTNGSLTAMKIFNNGNIGINTTTDSGAELTIKGSGTTSSTTAFLVQNANATASLAITDSGSVLIGTTTDSGYKLDVRGGTVLINRAIFGLSSTGGQSLRVISSTGGVDNVFSVHNEGSSIQYFGITSNTGITTFNSNWNIGSRLSADTQSLFIQTDQATAAISTLTVRGGNATASNRGGGNLILSSGGSAGSGDGINGYISFNITNTTASTGVTNSTSEVARFSLGKNLLIGTTTDPGYKLNVSGSGNFTNNLTVTGSATISNVLTLTPQTPLPSGVPTGSFAVSSSVPPKPYFYDGTAWNALY